MAIVSAAIATAATIAACSSDEGGSPATTAPQAVTTTQPPATTTTVASTTTTTPPTEPTDPPTTETAPPTTTEADLEAQIAADYVRSWELRNELTSNPTLDNLDARVAEIAAPGTEEFDFTEGVRRGVGLARRAHRAKRPGHFSVTVEDVVLDGRRTALQTSVTVCYIDNRLRVDSAGRANW